MQRQRLSIVLAVAGDASSTQARFYAAAEFGRATFAGPAYFGDVTFSSDAAFYESKFSEPFQDDFDNAAKREALGPLAYGSSVPSPGGDICDLAGQRIGSIAWTISGSPGATPTGPEATSACEAE